ncbi:DUF2057 domain-containing protein [Vibrio cholerae]
MRAYIFMWFLVVASTHSSHAATLTPKRGVSILYINGQSAENKIGVNSIKEGYTQIVVRMDKNMSKGSSGDVFTSKPYVLTFTMSGDQATIDHPVARSSMEARAVFESPNPEWRLFIDGNEVEYTQGIIQGKTGFLPFSGLKASLAEYNEQRGIYFDKGTLVDKPVAAVSATVVTAAAVTDMPEAPQVAPQVVDTNNLEQLKAWYLKSSTEERKAFRRWMIDQE